MSILNLFNAAAKTVSSNSNTSFRRRKIRVQITLSKGQFKNGEGNTIILDDFGVAVKIEKNGPPEFGKASVEISGLSLDVMSQLSTLNMHPLFTRRNFLNVFAGDEFSGLSQIFAGSITSATADFNSAPEVKFKVEARIGYWGSVTAQGQGVVNGKQPASDFIAAQAKAAGLLFENQDVNAQIQNSVFTGSPIEQARQAANQIGAELIIDDEKMILIKNGASVKGNVPVISATSGLLGYPVMSQNGIECKAIFNPDFKFAGLVEIQSMVPKVAGQWRIIKLTHNLAANLPNAGQWESSITGYYPSMSGAVGKFM